MTRPLAWLALLLLLLASAVVHATGLSLPQCPSGRLSLEPWTGVLEDKASVLSPAQVQALPAERFDYAGAGRLQPGYSASTYWLRVQIDYRGAEACANWFLAGPARLQNVVMYVSGGDGWRRMVSGSAYPLREWALPARQPLFPLELAPGRTTVLLLRVQGMFSMGFTPQLLSQQAFLFDRIRENGLDGMMFGSMLLLVLFSLILGRVMKLPVLSLLALAVLCYIGYVMVLEGYAFMYLWPGSPRWNQQAGVLLLSLDLAAANAYCCAVIEVKRMGRRWERVFAASRWIVVLLGVARLNEHLSHPAGAVLQGFDLGIRVLLVTAVIAGIRQGWQRRWFPPVLVALVLFEFFTRHALTRDLRLLGRLIPYAPDGHLSSTLLPGGALLAATLISQVVKSMRREAQARVQLDEMVRGEQEKLERTVALRTKELDAALRARQTLLARISHDLRAPLSAIVDGVRLWGRGEGQRDYPRLIEHSVRQQLDLIDELIEFSQGELNQLELAPAPGYLYGFLQEMGEQAQLLCERNGNALKLSFASDLPIVVAADFKRLRQVLMNVLGNAAKFTGGGHIDFAVTRLEAPPTRSRLHFSVDDDGIGLGVDGGSALARPFVRGANAAHHEGNGLGLAIVDQLLAYMGSTLEIGTSPLGGCRVSFVLDTPAAGEDALEADVAGLDMFPVPKGDGRCLLVVDDRQHDRELLCDVLESYGYNTWQAADGGEALETLRHTAVDAVLTDQSMGGMDGWELLAALRHSQPGLPVVLYSARPPQRPVQVGESLAFDAHLLKPAHDRELLACIDRLILARVPAGA